MWLMLSCACNQWHPWSVKVCLLFLYMCSFKLVRDACMVTVTAMFLLDELPFVVHVYWFLTGIHGSLFKGTVSLSCMSCLPHSERNLSEEGLLSNSFSALSEFLRSVGSHSSEIDLFVSLYSGLSYQRKKSPCLLSVMLYTCIVHLEVAWCYLHF